MTMGSTTGRRGVVLSAFIWVTFAASCDRTNDWLPAGAGIDSGSEDGECQDGDGDGHGLNCPAGVDCDDGDPLHFADCPRCLAGPATGCACEAGTTPIECYEGADGTAGVGICTMGLRSCSDGSWGECTGQVLPMLGEVCNDEDDDCDGMIDEGADGECGDCDPTCVSDSLGDGGEEAWNPGDDNSEGVSVDPELNGLILDSASVNTDTIWVANSVEGTVSKVDVSTYEEIGRFALGTDPSRTSVNTLGDVYVGLRNGFAVAKISTLGERCPDTNGDGVITTSTGHDVLPAGQDDCVLWTVPLPGGGVIRGVAAQDVYGPDGDVRTYVWVGGYDGYLWKLDGETGEILINATAAPTHVYGLALDGNGNLWTSGNGSAAIGRVDTTRCIDDASCNVEVCAGEGLGDDCIKQSIPYPLANPYGITVDSSQRVWAGGGNGSTGGGPCRYDQSLAAGSRWSCANVDSYVGGVAADSEGYVWAAGTGWAVEGARLEVFRIDAETPTSWTTVAGASGWGNHGMAVDAFGKVWAINYTNHNATVITPGPTLHEATVETNVAPFFVYPYTYSDMTGSQLRFVMPPRGWYRAVFSGCDEEETIWEDLSFDLFTPARTSVVFRARAADAPTALAEEEWVLVASIPDAVSPVHVGDALEAAGVGSRRYLEVEVLLMSEVTDGSMSHTPIVYDFSVSHRCPLLIE